MEDMYEEGQRGCKLVSERVNRELSAGVGGSGWLSTKQHRFLDFGIITIEKNVDQSGTFRVGGCPLSYSYLDWSLGERMCFITGTELSK